MVQFLSINFFLGFLLLLLFFVGFFKISRYFVSPCISTESVRSLRTCTQSNALSGACSIGQKYTSRHCAMSLWDQKFLNLRNSNVCHRIENSRPWSLTWTRTIQYASSCPVSLSSFWILSSPPFLLILPRNIFFQILFVGTPSCRFNACYTSTHFIIHVIIRMIFGEAHICKW